jgi:hypothetical protein
MAALVAALASRWPRPNGRGFYLAKPDPASRMEGRLAFPGTDSSLILKRACRFFVNIKNAPELFRIFAAESANCSNPKILQIIFC